VFDDRRYAERRKNGNSWGRNKIRLCPVFPLFHFQTPPSPLFFLDLEKLVTLQPCHCHHADSKRAGSWNSGTLATTAKAKIPSQRFLGRRIVQILLAFFSHFLFTYKPPRRVGGKIYKSLEKQQQITQAGMLSISYLD